MITDARDLEIFIKSGDYRTIYFDIDGVVANFNLEYFERTGEKPEDNPAKVWNTFIDWVDRGFFCTLLPIRPTVRLALKLNREGYDVRTLTACGPYGRKFKDIKAQKIYWTTKYLPEITQLFVEKGTDKKYFVRHGKKSLLIDDQLSNVTAFIDYGGSGVHYVPDYDYPEESPIATLEEEIMGLHEMLDTLELENAELKNPIITEERLRGVILDLEDNQWRRYCRDERTF